MCVPGLKYHRAPNVFHTHGLRFQLFKKPVFVMNVGFGERRWEKRVRRFNFAVTSSSMITQALGRLGVDG